MENVGSGDKTFLENTNTGSAPLAAISMGVRMDKVLSNDFDTDRASENGDESTFDPLKLMLNSNSNSTTPISFSPNICVPEGKSAIPHWIEST